MRTGLASKPSVLVVVFLAAAVTANLAVSAFGQAALLVTAWVLIPFDLVARDVLHEKWRGSVLPRMALLIAAGGILTAAVNWNARRVALASVAGFVGATSTNAAVYHVMRRRARLVRMNVSNLFAAAVDSTVFPVLAFPVVNVGLCAGQALSKFFGGLVWSWVFVNLVWRPKRDDLHS